MKRRIYLSGGMSGVERAVYVRRFGEAEAILRRHGYGCINPCRVWACRWPWIYRAMEWAMGKRLAYAVVLCYDLLLLMTRADGIAMLSGWLPTTERHWQMAQRISGLEKPNMFVYGGGDDVAEWCKQHDVVHVKEYMNRGRNE